MNTRRYNNIFYKKCKIFNLTGRMSGNTCRKILVKNKNITMVYPRDPLKF